jgi:glutathione S-transferase
MWMLDYLPISDLIARPGLRLVLVKGFPSPWGQAAKTIFEVKGLDYAVGALEAGGDNAQVLAWAGENSAPIVAWNDEPPLNRWYDILMLAERLAPVPALVPEAPLERALMMGYAHELCGELGLGWNRRLQIFAPMLDSGQAPEPVARMGAKYRYAAADARAASERCARLIEALAAQLRTQNARGRPFFIGERLSALDLYWVAFMYLLDLPPAPQCPVDPAIRPMFELHDARIRDAIDPVLYQHRDRVSSAYFRNPMEL